jgi:hypothetical protein
MPPPSGRRGSMGVLGRTLEEKATRRPKKFPHCWLDLASKIVGTSHLPTRSSNPNIPRVDLGCWKIAAGRVSGRFYLH